jgi:hypothetical protein
MIASQTALNFYWLWHPLLGPGYQFWSGVASDISEITLLAGAFAIYKQHNCKGRWWCPMWAHHKVDGTTASVCHVHHTAEHHERLQRRHNRKHPDRLAHGESPDP